jgi:hypothetical protein
MIPFEDDLVYTYSKSDECVECYFNDAHTPPCPKSDKGMNNACCAAVGLTDYLFVKVVEVTL